MKPDEALLSLLNPGLDSTTASSFNLLSLTGWQQVIDLADEHRLTPWLYYCVRSLKPALNLPETIEQHLRSNYHSCALVTLQMRQEVSAILTALDEEKVPVIVLKGPHLAELVYPDPSLRPMSDLDLLVASQDASRVESILNGLGYQPDPQYPPILPHRHHQVPYIHAGSVMSVEIHWRLGVSDWPFNLDLDAIWQRAHPARLAGAPAFVLSPVDLVWYLCVHQSFNHRLLTGLRPLCDVAETIRRMEKEIDWLALQERCTTWGAGQHVYLVLALAREWLAAPVPEDVLQKLRPSDWDDRWLARAGETILYAVNYNPPEDLGSKLWAQLLTAQTWRVRLAAVWKAFFPERNILEKYYAPPGVLRQVILLSYLLRWIDLLKRNLRVIYRLLRGDHSIRERAARTVFRTRLRRK